MADRWLIRWDQRVGNRVKANVDQVIGGSMVGALNEFKRRCVDQQLYHGAVVRRVWPVDLDLRKRESRIARRGNFFAEVKGDA